MITLKLYNTIVIVWIALGILMFPLILKVTAPYGRHSKSNWGPMLDNRVGWFIMESPALFLVIFFVFKGNGLYNAAITIFFLLWLLHYVHRTLIFPLRLKTKGKKMPMAIVASAFFFNLVNGFIIGYWMGFLTSEFNVQWLTDPRFLLGVTFFLSGYIINQYHDRILLRLRKNNGGGYKIPFGGLFNYISCPNFLGEIIEWGGFAMLTWCMPTLSFFIWTMVNLIPRALDHHKWYINKFPEYPPKRKAVIPFIL